MTAWTKTLKLYGWRRKDLKAAKQALLKKQGYKCATCPNLFDGTRLECLDHDHHTGELRGVLCVNCNRFKVAKNRHDDIDAVSAYLKNPPAAGLFHPKPRKGQVPTLAEEVGQ
jgi:DNA-directed RNA polymerase subunit RPC12/RpoP